MKQLKINNFDIEVNKDEVKKFLQQLVYPIAIIDFETFRILQTKENLSLTLQKDFSQKIFSAAMLIINSPEQLLINDLSLAKWKLFSKTYVPEEQQFGDFTELLTYQTIFFNFMINRLFKHKVKSLVLLGAPTEINLLKNYLIYFSKKSRFHKKIKYFFASKNIFDLYDLWNNDEILNIPEYKISKNQQIGATKKTVSLIKTNKQFLAILKPDPPISNSNIGKIIDQYFSNKCSLLPNFLPFVNVHNENDVITGALILAILYNIF